MERQPEPRATVGVDAFVQDENGQPIAVTLTLAFPKGQGLTAVGAVRHMATDHIEALVRAALFDPATRERFEQFAFETLMEKAMQS